MRLSDFDYKLPTELIAQFPLAKRTDSRLLQATRLNNGAIVCQDGLFSDILQLLKANDLLIFNDTRVIPARLFAKKETGGHVEILIERVSEDQKALAQIKASKSPQIGAQLIIDAALNIKASVQGRQDSFYLLKFSNTIAEVLNQYGEVPLPPYITHTPDQIDVSRYQTVLAKNPGAVAAPTAGLHFDEDLLEKIAQLGIRRATVTLHVGAGTFTPVRHEDLSLHEMHSEWYSIPEETLQMIQETKKNGGRIICVGTTSLRTLESYANHGNKTGETNLFITPGYSFKLVDCLITNFHLPKSTLLMLVSAFSGSDLIRQAYAHAIEKQYRFFSYGDAMFLNRQT